MVASNEDEAERLNTEGNALLQQGRVDEAEARYRAAIAARPELYKPYSNLGAIARRRGAREEAVALYRRAIALEPTAARARGALGATLLELGQREEGERALREALALQPELATAAMALLRSLASRGAWDELLAVARECAPRMPGEAPLWLLWADVLTRRGRFVEAAEVARSLIGRGLGGGEAYGLLGVALDGARDFQGALEAVSEALRREPDNAEHALRAGMVFLNVGRSQEALRQFRAACERDPTMAAAHMNVGGLLLQQGEVDEAIRSFERGVEHAPRRSDVLSSLLLALNYGEDRPPHEVFAAHRRWNDRFAAEHTRAAAPFAGLDRDPERRLRVGYVSADLRDHSVARFLEPLLAVRDRACFDVVCFYDGARADAVTARLRSLCDGWHDVYGLSNDAVAARVRSERIDVLIDLGGHTAGGSRLLTFARRPAPVQVTFLGYPNTTGLDAMDHRLTDAIADPPGASDARCSERLVRLPECAWCFDPGVSVGEPGPPPSAGSGVVAYGSFNNLAKIGPGVIDTWAEILRTVPRSVLRMKAEGLRDPDAVARVRGRFAARGIEVDRVQILPWARDREAHLRRFDDVDLALDSFPYHGTTTTCDALWMGVPVVVLEGDVHASRVGSSLLHAVGLDDLIARSREAYVRLAVQVGQDLPRLQRERSTLRARLRASVLGDPSRFVPGYERALREMWRAYCAHSAG
jgi:protein O-GlcNAc transferase